MQTVLIQGSETVLYILSRRLLSARECFICGRDCGTALVVCRLVHATRWPVLVYGSSALAGAVSSSAVPASQTVLALCQRRGTPRDVTRGSRDREGCHPYLRLTLVSGRLIALNRRLFGQIV